MEEMERCIDGQKDGWKDGRMEEWNDDRWVEGNMDELKDGWMERCINVGKMDGHGWVKR